MNSPPMGLSSFRDFCLLKSRVKSRLEYFISSNLNMIHKQSEGPQRRRIMQKFRRKAHSYINADYAYHADVLLCSRVAIEQRQSLYIHEELEGQNV